MQWTADATRHVYIPGKSGIVAPDVQALTGIDSCEKRRVQLIESASNAKYNTYTKEHLHRRAVVVDILVGLHLKHQPLHDVELGLWT